MRRDQPAAVAHKTPHRRGLRVAHQRDVGQHEHFEAVELILEVRPVQRHHRQPRAHQGGVRADIRREEPVAPPIAHAGTRGRPALRVGRVEVARQREELHRRGGGEVEIVRAARHELEDRLHAERAPEVGIGAGRQPLQRLVACLGRGVVLVRIDVAEDGHGIDRRVAGQLAAAPGDVHPRSRGIDLRQRPVIVPDAAGLRMRMKQRNGAGPGPLHRFRKLMRHLHERPEHHVRPAPRIRIVFDIAHRLRVAAKLAPHGPVRGKLGQFFHRQLRAVQRAPLRAAVLAETDVRGQPVHVEPRRLVAREDFRQHVAQELAVARMVNAGVARAGLESRAVGRLLGEPSVRVAEGARLEQRMFGLQRVRVDIDDHLDSVGRGRVQRFPQVVELAQSRHVRRNAALEIGLAAPEDAQAQRCAAVGGHLSYQRRDVAGLAVL